MYNINRWTGQISLKYVILIYDVFFLKVFQKFIWIQNTRIYYSISEVNTFIQYWHTTNTVIINCAMMTSRRYGKTLKQNSTWIESRCNEILKISTQQRFICLLYTFIIILVILLSFASYFNTFFVFFIHIHSLTAENNGNECHALSIRIIFDFAKSPGDAERFVILSRTEKGKEGNKR